MSTTDGPCRVLVVDDEELLRTLLHDALTYEGYEVREAADGQVALDLLQHWQPDVIVLDLMMPGLDGWSFRQEQYRRGLALNTPVIVISAARDLRHQADVLRAQAIMPKPFELEYLLETINRLGEARSRAVD